MEPPFDPIDRWGTGWKPGRDGSTRRVVPHRGQYCFEIRDSRGRVQYVSIPNTITPPRDPSTPRSETTSSGQLLPSQRPADPGGHQRQVGYNSEYPRENARSLVANRLTAGLGPLGNPGLPSSTESHGLYELVGSQPSSAGAMRPHDTQRDNGPPPSGRSLQLQPAPARPMALPGGPSLDLSDLELEFVRIPLKQFAACRRFIDSNPSILNTNTDDLSTAAIAAATNGSDSLSQQCVQRLVILNDCRGRSSRDRAAYFNELASAGSHGSRDFQNQCQRVEQRVAARVQGSRPPPQAVSAPSSNSQPLGIAGANTYAVTLPIRTGQSAYQASIDQRSEAAGNYRSTPSSHPIRQGEYSTTRQGDPAGFPTRLPLVTSLSHPDDEDTNQIQSEEPGRPQPGYPGTQDPRPPGRQRRHSQRSSQGDLGQRRNLYTQTLPTAHGGDAAEFRGESQPGPLDKSYKVRGDARTFFTPGTMFVMIWYENWGGQHKRAGAASDKNTSSRFRGEKVYTTPRRMVVIRQRRGYCVCVPIYSYGGQGVKSNMPESEKQAHAIIHAQGRPAPEPLSTEPEFKKRPIAADMNAGETLTATSRIHFAKYHTVEHNVKVKEIGRIAGESMADFVSYWRQELLGP